MADVTLFARRQLAATPAVVAMVGSSTEWPVWIWRWRPQVPIEGTGKRALVISRPRAWGAPNRHNTAAFPMVQVDAYADPTRDASGRPTKADGEERALELADAVRAVLHVPRGAEIEWGDAQGKLRVVSSVCGQDPEVVRAGDGEAVRAITAFEVTVS